MDGQDLHRRIASRLNGRAIRQSLSALWRKQPVGGGNAADWLKSREKPDTRFPERETIQPQRKV